MCKGDNFKYKITFQYPYLIKTTTIGRVEGDHVKDIQDFSNQKNAEIMLYGEKDQIDY